MIPFFPMKEERHSVCGHEIRCETNGRKVTNVIFEVKRDGNDGIVHYAGKP